MNPPKQHNRPFLEFSTEILNRYDTGFRQRHYSYSCNRRTAVLGAKRPLRNHFRSEAAAVYRTVFRRSSKAGPSLTWGPMIPGGGGVEAGPGVAIAPRSGAARRRARPNGTTGFILAPDCLLGPIIIIGFLKLQ
jgi:hypothetical protein